MSIANALAGIAVKDLDAAVAWYGDLLGREPDARPMKGLAEWRFEKGGWIQLFADAVRAGNSSVTLVEDDLDGQVKVLESKGVTVGTRSENDYVKTAMLKDPDGNQVVLAQSLSDRNDAASA